MITAVHQLGAVEDEAIHPENLPVIAALYVSYAAVVALLVSKALETLRTVKRCAAIKQKRGGGGTIFCGTHEGKCLYQDVRTSLKAMSPSWKNLEIKTFTSS